MKPALLLLLSGILTYGRHLTDRSHGEILRLVLNGYQDDIYFEGEHIDDNQPEITADDLPKDGELFEEDMVMDDSIRRAVLGLNNKRSAVSLAEEGREKHWPHGIIPFKFHPQILSYIKDEILKAIGIFANFTCIKFAPKQDNDLDYVLFTSEGKGCASSVGRIGGEQTVKLAAGCSRIGTVVHEMMHVLGIIHEQSRPDRDTHLNVNFDNIKPKLVHNFRKYNFYDINNLDVDYNFNSVMHYSNYAFSKNGEPTLVSKLDHDLRFGQRSQITRSDIQQINHLYNCHVKYDDSVLLSDMTDEQVLRNKRARENEEDEEERENEFQQAVIERLVFD